MLQYAYFFVIIIQEKIKNCKIKRGNCTLILGITDSKDGKGTNDKINAIFLLEACTLTKQSGLNPDICCLLCCEEEVKAILRWHQTAGDSLPMYHRAQHWVSGG